nr:methyltransferase domain-containing protein [Pseudonocardiales bacterium]
MSSDPQPNPHATAEQVEAARHDRKLANVLYHDWEAGSYDDKWSISYDERCITYAADRFRYAAGDGGWPYDRALELGCGTGFFLLNLMQAGLAKRGSATDLSPGMVAAALRNAEHLGLDVDGRVADAEQIPYADATFDVVVGHAVLHHIPDLDAAFREVLRVLKPGGRFVFAGEPTRIGDRYARRLGGLTWKATTSVTRLAALASWRRPQSELDESSRAAALEALVDIHTFDPAALEAIARAAGAADARVVTEELTAAMLGWPVRTFEAAMPPGKLGMGWAMFAYRSWQRLSWLDDHVLARV